ncbi:MAG: SpoIIE family protein phosphatase [Prevotella sp.]|nr:SpoIIE family protein phosphatase [Prevotella sp.]
MLLKYFLLLFVLLVGMPARGVAMSEAASTLRNRQLALYETDSLEAFEDVTARLKRLLEKEGEDKVLYSVWYNEVMYVLTYVSSSRALEMAGEMKDYAQKHDSKDGFYMATMTNALIAFDMNLIDMAEKLLQQAIAYKERYLPERKPGCQIYALLNDIYNDKEQWDEAIHILDKAQSHDYWNGNERVILATLKCFTALKRVPKDSVMIEQFYDELHKTIDETGYTGDYNRFVECHYAKYQHQYGKMLELSKPILDPELRLPFVIAALEGLGRYKESLDSFKVLKDWTDKKYNDETRNLTEKKALELQAARAENETTTLRLTQQRTVLAAVVCGLVLIAAFLVIYLRRRQQQMRELKQAYDQLEEVTTQKERIESELRIARDIQMSMVPMAFPDYPGLDLYASMTPAKEVGGDLYGYMIQGDRLYFCVGDVSGKGVPASLFMAQAARLFRTLSAEGMMPADLAVRMNNELAEGNDRSMFVTMFIGLLHLDTGRLDFCNAGHNPPVIGGNDQHGEFLKVEQNLAIGLFPDLEFTGEHIDSIKGRPLFIYTDGLNEAENDKQELFGDDRMLDILRHTHFDSARQVIEAITAEVEKHRNGAAPNDDLTLLCLNYFGETFQKNNK